MNPEFSFSRKHFPRTSTVRSAGRTCESSWANLSVGQQAALWPPNTTSLLLQRRFPERNPCSDPKIRHLHHHSAQLGPEQKRTDNKHSARYMITIIIKKKRRIKRHIQLFCRSTNAAPEFCRAAWFAGLLAIFAISRIQTL